MIDKNGYEFEFAEKETGFVEEATAVFVNSLQSALQVVDANGN